MEPHIASLFLAGNIAGPIITLVSWFGLLGLQFAEHKVSRAVRITLAVVTLAVGTAFIASAFVLFGRQAAWMFASSFFAIPVSLGCLMRWYVYRVDTLPLAVRKVHQRAILRSWGYR